MWPPGADTTLVGRRVTLTPTTADDAGALFTAWDDAEFWTYLIRQASSVGDIQAWVAHVVGAGWFPWTITYEGDVVGTVSLFDASPDDARVEIGTRLGRRAWGTPVNPECKLLVLGWAFDHGFGRVQMKTDIRNERSQRAMASMGARCEGVLRRYQRRDDGTVRDTVMFSVIAEDWPDVRARLERRLCGDQDGASPIPSFLDLAGSMKPGPNDPEVDWRDERRLAWEAATRKYRQQ